MSYELRAVLLEAVYIAGANNKKTTNQLYSMVRQQYILRQRFASLMKINTGIAQSVIEKMIDKRIRFADFNNDLMARQVREELRK